MTSDRALLRAHPVEQAVYAVIGQGAPKPLKAVRAKARKAAVFAELRDRLTQLGLLLDVASARRALRQALWLVPVLLLGIAWLFPKWPDGGQWPDGPPNSFLVVLLMAVGAGVLLLIAGAVRLGRGRGRPRPTRRGRMVLSQLSWDYNRLLLVPEVQLRSTGGLPRAPPMAIALFGRSALWEADSDLAAALALPHEAVMRQMRQVARYYAEKYLGY